MGWNTQLARPIAVDSNDSGTLRTMAEASHFLFDPAQPACDCTTAARGAVCEAVLTGSADDVQRATDAMEKALSCRPRLED
ncbi:MAG: hypothetical protein B7Y70_15905 [Rhizobiales bacterium 35-68-8]|nr:MAG: hypothetical protein B7Y70_15905 [Rhizobiales bacterium 35-68-8]